MLKDGKFSLRTYLLGLVVISLVPALGIGGGTAFMMQRDLQQSLETRVRATAEAIAVAVDRQIETRRSVLDAISQGVAFDFLTEEQPRDSDFYRQSLARVYIASSRFSARIGVPVVLFRPDTSVVFRSNVPLGEPLTPLIAVAEFNRVIATRTSVVGNLYQESRLLIPVLTPIVRDEKVVGVLGASISFDFLAGVLDAVKPTDIAFMSIIDANGLVVAASPREPSTMVGRRVRQWQLDAIAALPNGGIAHGRSLLNVAVLAAIQPIPAAPGWSVAVGVPQGQFGGLVSRPFFWLALGGAIVLILSLALAVFLAHRLLRPVVALTKQAEALAMTPQAGRALGADSVGGNPSPVAEIERLRLAITRANDVLRLLAREVDHRAKNSLAVVQAVVRMTKADNIQAYAKAINERVDALSRAHSLLASHGWEGASLLAVVGRELEAYADRIVMQGPEVNLSSSAVQPIAMLLHELAVNAAKYGALTTAAGRVDISWSIDPGRQDLVIWWRERGGPKLASPPERRGFGFRMIKATARQLGGCVSYGWLASGLECCFRIPASRVVSAKNGPAGKTSP